MNKLILTIALTHIAAAIGAREPVFRAMDMPDRALDYRVLLSDDSVSPRLSSPTNGVRRAHDLSKNVISALSVGPEPHSWLLEYNQYRVEHDSTPKSKNVVPTADHPSGHDGQQDLAFPLRKLSSQITSYENWEADELDLREWTHHVADSDNTKFSDYTYKEYGVPAYTTDDAEKQLNVRDFIEYLVSQHGFRRKDLVFLQSKELDHGLDEIERELDKIKDNQNQKNVIIDIGGETATPTVDSSIVATRPTPSATTRARSPRPGKTFKRPATRTKNQSRPTLDKYYFSDEESDEDVPRRKLKKNPNKSGKRYKKKMSKGGEESGAALTGAKRWLMLVVFVSILYGILL